MATESVDGEVFTDACRSCGRVFPIELLDAKPEHGADPDTSDWTRLECEDCYGPGYCRLDDDRAPQATRWVLGTFVFVGVFAAAFLATGMAHGRPAATVGA